MAMEDLSFYSMFAPFILGCVKFRKLHTAYLPFLLFILAGFVAEMVTALLVELERSYHMALNIYTLFQAWFIAWQFKNWQLFRGKTKLFWTLIIFYAVAWLAENIYLGFSPVINSYFIIISSYIIALMSINIINRLVVKEHGSLLKSAVFLICIGWLFYFTYSIISESFFKFGLMENKPAFAIRVYALVQYMNIFTNFVYAFAILWIPSKPKFILPS
jgi:hypothetical protein